MNFIHQSKIRKLLDSFDIQSLAYLTHFNIRRSGKISPFDLLFSFFLLVQSKCYSLRQWSLFLSFVSKQPISFQAISKRLNSRTLDFIKSFLNEALLKNILKKSCFHNIGISANFNRILIEDSTCINLPRQLHSAFPGSKNQHNSSAVARVQLRLDIISGNYLNCDLTSFKKHDATYAQDILRELKPNDLVLRDLGYSIYHVLDKIDKANAFYISRFKVNAKVYTVENQANVDLTQILKHVEKKGGVKFESTFLVGDKDKLLCRIVCFKLASQQIIKRTKQLKKNGNRNKNQDNYLHTWNIFITNLDCQKASIDEIHTLYSLRWYIELVFKTWKSYFDLNSIFQSVQGPNPIKPEILLYLCLAYITLIVNPVFKSYQNAVYKTYCKILSPIKFMKTLLNDVIGLLESSDLDVIDLLAKNCCYDIRKDRINIYEKLIYY